MAHDRVTSAQIVLANGTIATASKDVNPDLFFVRSPPLLIAHSLLTELSIGCSRSGVFLRNCHANHFVDTSRTQQYHDIRVRLEPEHQRCCDRIPVVPILLPVQSYPSRARNPGHTCQGLVEGYGDLHALGGLVRGSWRARRCDQAPPGHHTPEAALE